MWTVTSKCESEAWIVDHQEHAVRYSGDWKRNKNSDFELLFDGRKWIFLDKQNNGLLVTNFDFNIDKSYKEM